MLWRYQICIAKFHYSYRDDLPNIWAKPLPKSENRPLPVDMRRSKTSLLKLPNNDGARRSKRRLDQWQIGKSRTGSCVQSFPCAFAFTCDVVLSLLNLPNVVWRRQARCTLRFVYTTYCFGGVGHWFWELVRKKSQHSSERAQGSGKQNEERKFFFGVNGEFMVTWKGQKQKK